MTSLGALAPIGEEFHGVDPDAILIDEEFVETDIREALLLVAEEAGVDIVMDDNVLGIINTRIDQLPVDRAIEKLLMPLGFVYGKNGGQYIVSTTDPDSPLFPYIARRVEYRPFHMDAKTLASTVPDRSKPFVQTIDGKNLIIVEAPAGIAKEITERFASIDQPVPQVVLEAIICVVSPDSGFQFGLDWQHAVELNGANAFKLGAAGLALSTNYSRAGGNAIFDDFAQTSAFVKLLSEHGYLTIRATPHVMAEDGKKANIAINRETFFSVTPPGTSGDNSAFFFQQDIQTVESGITLDITPVIRGDVVTINIDKAEVSEDIRNANAELAVNPFPIINRRSVSTTVHVKDGKTIVIGGLVQRETVDRVNRVPGLSRLPGVGYLFETTQRQTREAEVVIFISPRIVTPPCFDAFGSADEIPIVEETYFSTQ
tara:strand:+ start:247944 stop:249230 length:1287 start_codon:yes stop_codon:yes gene_type:complete